MGSRVSSARLVGMLAWRPPREDGTGGGVFRAARWFPPAPIVPDIVIVCTPRHVCRPPLAATFFSTTAAAESLDLLTGASVPATSVKGSAAASNNHNVFRYIDDPLLQE